MTKTPSEIAPDLAEVYWIWKDAEAEKEVLRKKFFDAVTAAQTNLARKTVRVDPRITDPEEARAYAEQYNSGWKVDGLRVTEDGHHAAVIEEDPSLKGGTVVVPLDEPVEDRKGKEHPGYVVTKTIVGGSVLVDADRMQEWSPFEYEALTQFKGFGPDQQLAASVYNWLLEQDWPREIRGDLKDWEVELLKPFSYEGPRSAKLNVRYAKPDETPGT